MIHEKKNEMNLLESEQRYRCLFENTGTAMLIVNGDGLIEAANRECLNVTGYTHDQLLNTDWRTYVAPESLERLEDYFRSRFIEPEKAPGSYEAHLLNARGETKITLVTVGVISRENRQLVVSVQDITKEKQAVQQLRRNEKQLQQILAMSPACIYTLDPTDFSLRWVSPNIHTLLGYTNDEVMHPGWWRDSLHPADREQALARFREILGETKLTHEYRLRTKNGEFLWVNDQLCTIRDAEGSVVEILGTWIGISERKGAEDALRQSKERLETFLQVSQAMTASFELDGFMQVVVDNAARVMRLGSGAVYLLEQNDIRLAATTPSLPKNFPEKFRFLSLEEHPHIRETVSTGRPVCVPDAATEPFTPAEEEVTRLRNLRSILYLPIRLRKKAIGVLILASTSGLRVFDQEEISLLQGFGDQAALMIDNLRQYEEAKKNVVKLERQIADRMKAEAERALLMQAIEQTEDAVMVTDIDGTIQYVNAAFEAATGYTRAETLGRNPRLLKSGRQDRDFYRELWQTITGGRTWQGRMVNKRKDGTFFTEETTISPVKNDGGVIVNFVAVKRDITEYLRIHEEKARLEDQLHQAQKMESIGRLAGGVAHDFNNMLNVILGYGEFLLDEIHPGDPLRDDIEQIVEAATRSADLTRQLLAFSRKQTLQPESLNLNDLISNLDKMLRRLIGEDILLELALAPDLGPVLFDPGQFEQVIINLAVNARDAMPTGGKLLIETSEVELDRDYVDSHPGVTAGNYVLLAVTDTGCGIAPEVRDRIFEPFFTTKEAGKGTGLGLAMVYGIVKQSGGEILVYSELERGTAFKIYLPRTGAEPDREVESVVSVEPAAGEHILVVEDESALRRLTETILSRQGYRVSVAANGGEALLLVEEKGLQPDLIVTDVVMPNMSGRELVDRLRRTQPGLEVLYMSGYSDELIASHGVLDSNTPFIQKPFNTRNFCAKVRDVLRGAGRSHAPPATSADRE